MDLKTVKQTARELFGGACKVCPQCNGVVCAGEVPGMGGIGSGTTFKNNIAALAEYKVNMRMLHSVSEPSMRCNILGFDLAMPVLAAPIGGIAVNGCSKITEEEYCAAIALGCKQAGITAMTGDGPVMEVFDTGIGAFAHYDNVIPTAKPRETKVIVEMAARAKALGAKAFAIDVDAAAFANMIKMGQKVGPKTVDELTKIKEAIKLPLIIKGIMTAEEALLCADAGIDAIVVSNHGGRVLDHVPGTAEVLPQISAAVKGRITILVDGGIRNGIDILKMLALGADAVLIGRSLMIGAIGGGAEGVVLTLEKFAAELRAAMIMTGTADVKNIAQDNRILRRC